jgi:hypothetical protein
MPFDPFRRGNTDPLFKTDAEMVVVLKHIRIDSKSVRNAIRSTSGVRLLNLDDKVASATVIPPEDPKVNGNDGTLLQ